jgi:hypothetical protein
MNALKRIHRPALARGAGVLIFWALCTGGFGCSPREDAQGPKRLLALVTETREVELEALTRKVDPERLDLTGRIKRFDVSIHDTHKYFEEQMEFYERFNRELGGEIDALKEKIRKRKPGYKGRFPTEEHAWRRYWQVTRELERLRTLSWRKE